jgi:hypothetical protein
MTQARHIRYQVTADQIALWLPRQSAADLGEKRRRNSGAISRLFEPKDEALCKGRREGHLFSGYLGNR